MIRGLYGRVGVMYLIYVLLISSSHNFGNEYFISLNLHDFLHDCAGSLHNLRLALLNYWLPGRELPAAGKDLEIAGF